MTLRAGWVAQPDKATHEACWCAVFHADCSWAVAPSVSSTRCCTGLPCTPPRALRSTHAAREPVRKSRLMSCWVADISTTCVTVMPRLLSLWLQARLPKVVVPIAKVLRSQSRRPQRGARVPASFPLGAGVFRSFKGFCDAVFCAAAQGRGRSTWGMGWRALEEPKEGWVFLMGSAWPSAAGGLGCRRQVSEALCQ